MIVIVTNITIEIMTIATTGYIYDNKSNVLMLMAITIISLTIICIMSLTNIIMNIITDFSTGIINVISSW